MSVITLTDPKIIKFFQQNLTLDPNQTVSKMISIYEMISSQNNSKVMYEIESTSDENLKHHLSNTIYENNLAVLTQLSTLTNQILPITENMEKLMSRNANSSIKGRDGEIQLEYILNRLFPSAEIINNSKISQASDFLLKFENQSDIIIETKEYSKNVPKTEVEKFERDLQVRQLSGIFFSHNSGICNKKDFQLDFIDKQVFIYVHNCNYDPIKIELAVKIIHIWDKKIKEFMIDKPDYSLVLNNLQFNLVKTEFELFFKNKTDTILLMQNFNAQMIPKLNSMDFPFLATLFNKKKSNTETITATESKIVEIPCPHCSFSCKTKSSLTKHLKTHENDDSSFT